MRHGCAVTAARRELAVGAGAGHLEEHPVVAVVVTEAADLDQPESVAVEADELVEALGVTGDAELHHDRMVHDRTANSCESSPRRPTPSFRYTRWRWLSTVRTETTS